MGEFVATTSRLLVNLYDTHRRRPMDAMVSGCEGSTGQHSALSNRRSATAAPVYVHVPPSRQQQPAIGITKNSNVAPSSTESASSALLPLPS